MTKKIKMNSKEQEELKTAIHGIICDAVVNALRLNRQLAAHEISVEEASVFSSVRVVSATNKIISIINNQ